jgi:predicted nucleic acid-binding protein
MRTGELDAAQFAVAAQRLLRFDEAAEAVLPSEAIRSRADRLLGIHPLRAADAFQLAALLAASEERPADLPFVTLDDRLADAARKEGFPVLPD